MNRVNVIGLGGIGGMLVSPLCRYLNFSEGQTDVVLIDGDRFEKSNGDRQDISSGGIGRYKAEVWKSRLAADFRANLSSVEAFVKPDNIGRLIIDGDTVMLCVDNHATRKLVQDHCARLRNTVLVSGGNDYHDGNVQIFVKRNGRTLSPPLTRYHPEIASPRDKRPDEIGCDEEVASTPQLLFANMTAASLMLNAFYAIRQGTMKYNEVYFDITKNLTMTRARKTA
jgi:molybdopterin/thiamine biosynthesis adenylyltransferase